MKSVQNSVSKSVFAAVHNPLKVPAALVVGAAGGPPPPGQSVLLETADVLLLETGDNLILES